MPASRAFIASASVGIADSGRTMLGDGGIDIAGFDCETERVHHVTTSRVN